MAGARRWVRRMGALTLASTIVSQPSGSAAFKVYGNDTQGFWPHLTELKASAIILQNISIRYILILL